MQKLPSDPDEDSFASATEHPRISTTWMRRPLSPAAVSTLQADCRNCRSRLSLIEALANLGTSDPKALISPSCGLPRAKLLSLSLVEAQRQRGRVRMKNKASTERSQLVEAWSAYYPTPIAELIATITRPFDGTEHISSGVREAHSVARGSVKTLFADPTKRPTGGQIEGPLVAIAQELLTVMRKEDAGSSALQRLSHAVNRLSGATVHDTKAVDELEVPESVKSLDGETPFAMWR